MPSDFSSLNVVNKHVQPTHVGEAFKSAGILKNCTCINFKILQNFINFIQDSTSHHNRDIKFK